MIKTLRETDSRGGLINIFSRCNGTHLQGYIETTFSELKEAFGAPSFENYDPHEKVNAEWVLDINGKIATIYNWKTGRVPMGEYTWHVGGHDESVLEVLSEHGPSEARPSRSYFEIN